MKEELISGLQNAVERGATLEAAVQSFINAGYNPQEVREAARNFSSGVSTMLNYSPDAGKTFPTVLDNTNMQPNNPESNAAKGNIQTPQGSPQQPQQLQQLQQKAPAASTVQFLGQQPQAQQIQPQQPKSNKKLFLIIFLIVWLILLAGALVSIWFFRDQLLALIKP